MADFKVERMRITAPGSVTSQDYTIAGFGEVDAVVALQPMCYTASPSPSTTLGVSVGVWDGTTHRSIGVRSSTASSPTYCVRSQSHDDILCRPSPSAGGVPMIPVARVTANVTDGITISWLEGVDFEVELIFVRAASGATVIAKALSTVSTQNTIALTHDPNGLIAFTAGLSAAGSGTENLITLGAAKWDGTTTTQAFASFYSQDGVATVNNGQILKNAEVAAQPTTSETWSAAAVMSTNQLNLVTTTTSTGADYVLGLVFGLADPDDWHVEIVDTPTVTGSHAYTGLPHTPGWSMAIGSRLTAVNTMTTDATASGFSVSTADENGYGTIGISLKDAVAATSGLSTSYANALPLAVYDGDQAVEYSASAVTFNAGEVAYTFDVVDATPRKMILLSSASPAAAGTITSLEYSGVDEDSFAPQFDYTAPAIPAAPAATSFDHLEDQPANPKPSVITDGYPIPICTETQNISTVTVEALSKYKVLGFTPGMYAKSLSVQAVDPTNRGHAYFSPRAYQGYDLGVGDECDYGYGLNFNVTGAATGPDNCTVYAGHWLYFAGTTLTSGINDSTLTVQVADGSLFDVGSYVCIYDAPAGSFNNPEHALVVDVTGNTVTLDARGYKSTAASHASGSIIAQHAIGQGGGDTRNWAYNISTACPEDSNGNTMGQALVGFLVANIRKKSNGDDIGGAFVIDAIFADADEYFPGDPGQTDADNDLVADDGIADDGTCIWGEGLDRYYSDLSAAFPAEDNFAGARSSRGFRNCNGIQLEGWPVTGDYASENPDYGHAADGGTGTDGLDSNLQRYVIHQSYHQPSDIYLEMLVKTPVELYPDPVTVNDIPNGNRPFRFGLALGLICGNCSYGLQNSPASQDCWFDEYAVDMTDGNYRNCVPSNPADESAVRAARFWLGQPVGQFERVYDTTAFAKGSAMASDDFTSDITGWTTLNCSIEHSTDHMAVSGAGSLHIIGHTAFDRSVSGTIVYAPLVSLTAGQEYTVCFAAKSAEMRQMSFKLDTVRSTFLIPEDWTRCVHTFRAANTGNYSPRFMIGREDKELWIGEFYVFAGNANVFKREFDNGLLVANATPSAVEVDLGGDYLRLLGTQDAINSGHRVSVLQLPAYEGAILAKDDWDMRLR